MRILFAAAEAAPLVKVGGLADVASALPRALVRHGHEVWLLIPRYRALPWTETFWRTRIRFGSVEVDVEASIIGTYNGVSYVAVGWADGLEWISPGGYSATDVVPYILLSRAVAQFSMHPDWRGDVLHCNDWQFAHAVAHLSRLAGPRSRCRTVLTIHNLAYQGLLPLEVATAMRLAGYPERSLLAQGVSSADVVTTVSDAYRKETLTAAHGQGLDALLGSLGPNYHGIRNGLDYDEFNPSTDPYLPFRYDVQSMAGKAADKAELQGVSGLSAGVGLPLLGYVGRLVRQKGAELLLAAIDRLSGSGAQIVVVGCGVEYEKAFEQAAARYPHMAYHPDSSEQMARLAYSGSDIFLAPSAFEPCGLAPMIALRYGSVPVVHNVGGMAETIGNTQLGFTFHEYSVDAFVRAITDALARLRDEPAWRARQAAGMRTRFSWDDVVPTYASIYDPARCGAGES